jgi:SWI/SNF-related matrix-associated actin-dependent regulator 1 of chromatin subfamily A
MSEFKQIKAKRRLFLTGTPILNRPKEIWSLISSLDPVTYNSYYRFAYRYCGAHKGRFGFDDTGATNLDELQNKLRSTIMVRRLKVDVLKDLPAKRRQIIEFPKNGATVQIDNEVKVMSKAMEQLHHLRVAVELSKASDDINVYKDAVNKLRDGASAAFQEIAIARRDTAVAKIPYVIEHLKNCSGKVIVFAHHHVVIDALYESLGKEAVKVTGSVNMTARQEAVDRFQNDPSCLFFIGNIKAAGVGITLTAASHVVFAEITYTPADLLQAEDRAHRIGQKESVLVQHLVLEGSIDSNMARSIVAKMGIIDQALDKHNAITDLDIPVLPDPPITATSTRLNIDSDAEKISVEQSASILQCLQIISSMDADGARAQNKVGFNRLDTDIGRSLAMNSKLTFKQAALGKRLVNKYRGQIDDKDLLAKAMGA